MKIYIIRHADAFPLGPEYPDDHDRALTPDGFQQAKRLATSLRRHQAGLQVVLTSPLLRARQTAEEMRRHGAQPAPELRVCEELAPSFKRRSLARFLYQLGVGNVALVGHQPDLGEFSAWLIGGKKARI